MDWGSQLSRSDSPAGSVLVLAVAVTLGLALGALRVRGVALGIGGVLFSGLALGHLGATIEPSVMAFAQDFGLILFVYAVGVQVGPGFLSSLRRQGIGLNSLAASIVVVGAVLAMLIAKVARIEVPVAVGMLSGATTNTPSLGAAQAALRDLPQYTPQMGKLPGLGYAVAYPFGIIGLIFAMILTRAVFARRSTATAGASAGEPSPPAAEAAESQSDHDSLQVLPIFLGISLGVVLGSIPVPVRGLPAPLRLGLAGGPLVAATALGAIGSIGPLSWRLPVKANLILREVGIALFLACVGIRSGGLFVHTLTAGDGLRWMAWATLITFLPVMLGALVARAMLRSSYATVCGMMAGSMTDPPALAFAASATRSPETTLAYATVYPLTMVLRIMSAQVIVLLLMR